VTAFLPLAQAEWGTVPDWVTAFGTLAAFAVALRLLAKELTARREYEEDRRREQASRVACWVGVVVEDPYSPPAPWASEIGTPKVAAVLNNGSEEPVYYCRVHLELDPAGIGTFWEGDRRLTLAERVVPPGRMEYPLRLSDADPPDVSAWMTFTDGAGRRWTRHPDGRLVEPDRPRRRSRKDFYNAWIAGELDQLDY
jgi:hypothetical protein